MLSTVVDRAASLADATRFAAARGVLTGMIVTRSIAGDAGAKLLGPAGRRDPYPLYDALREGGRLVNSVTGPTTASHPVSDAILRDTRFGSVRPRRRAPRDAVDRLTRMALLDSDAAIAQATTTPGPLGPDSLIGSDPPDHTRLRRLVSRAFTPRAVASWRPRVERTAHDLLDAAVGARTGQVTFDLMPTLAGPLPVLVISQLLGVPVEDRQRFQDWGDELALALDLMSRRTFIRVVAALEELDAYFTVLFEHRRAHPGDEVIDTLLAASADEDGLTPRELLATTLLLLVAGFETTVNLIGNGVLALLQHPDQLQRLRDQPDLVPNAVEEMLRFDAPVQRDVRFARNDLEFEGRQIRERAPVLMMLGGANRDPAVFADPHTFDVGRANAHRHLAFASGIHYCLGAALARLEGEIAVNALLERFSHLELAGRVERRRGLVLRGLSSLPVRGRIGG